MTYKSHSIPNEHNFICDRCGFLYKSHNKRKEWTGLIVCKGAGTNNCWEPRHPQDFVRARAEENAVKESRPDSDPKYIGTDIYVNGVTADDL